MARNYKNGLTQKEVEKNEIFSVFSYFLCPTFDFQQELLSMGETVEVLEPLALRRELSRIGKEMSRKNGGKPSGQRGQRR